MSCCGPAVIGATCDDQINYGETINLSLVYTDDAGNPIDLSSASVAVYSSRPDIIKNAGILTITDAQNGEVSFLLERDAAVQLRRGLNNRFRIQAIFGPQSDDITPDIYIQVT